MKGSFRVAYRSIEGLRRLTPSLERELGQFCIAQELTPSKDGKIMYHHTYSGREIARFETRGTMLDITADEEYLEGYKAIYKRYGFTIL